MSVSIVEFNGKKYPNFQTEGNAAKFAIQYALQVCCGVGYDVGCSREDWKFPGAIPIDTSFDDEYHALNLPQKDVDYIFSSHCLEHVEDWVSVLDYWYDVLRPGGVLFLYLPDYSQEYWRPWNNRKHKHAFNSELIYDYMEYKGYINIFYSGVDLNNSFMVFGEK